MFIILYKLVGQRGYGLLVVVFLMSLRVLCIHKASEDYSDILMKGAGHFCRVHEQDYHFYPTIGMVFIRVKSLKQIDGVISVWGMIIDSSRYVLFTLSDIYGVFPLRAKGRSHDAPHDSFIHLYGIYFDIKSFHQLYDGVQVKSPSGYIYSVATANCVHHR